MLGVKICRDANVVLHPFTEYLKGFDEVEAVRKIFGEGAVGDGAQVGGGVGSRAGRGAYFRFTTFSRVFSLFSSLSLPIFHLILECRRLQIRFYFEF